MHNPQACVCAQGLPQVLINLLVSFVPSNNTGQALVSAACKGYVETGLAKLCGMQLQCKTLGAVMQLLEQPKDSRYLGQHAFPVCLPPFLQFVEADMERFTQRCEPDIINETLDLSPYLDMLGKRSLLSQVSNYYEKHWTLQTDIK